MQTESQMNKSELKITDIYVQYNVIIIIMFKRDTNYM